MSRTWTMLRGEHGSPTVLVVTADAERAAIKGQPAALGPYVFLSTPAVALALLGLARMELIIVLGDVPRIDRDRVEVAVARLRADQRGILTHVTDDESARAMITHYMDGRMPASDEGATVDPPRAHTPLEAPRSTP